MTICLISLSACSPYVYNQEIMSFTSGVNSIVSSYQTGQQSLVTLVLQDQQADYVKARSKLTLAAGCLDSNALPPDLLGCAIVPLSEGFSPLSQVTQSYLKSQAQVARAAQIFDALQMYTAALTAVTNATDDATLKLASQNLGGAVGTFSDSIAKIAPGTTVSNTVINSATNLINLGVTAYLDTQRYAVLRATVPAMDAPVSVAGKTMKDALLSIRQVQLAHMVNDLTTTKEPFETGAASKLNQSEYQSQLVALQSKVAAFNQARASNPSATVSAMIEAHKQLATALLNDAGQTHVVLTATLNFASAAEELKASVDAGTTIVPKAVDADADAKK